MLHRQSTNITLKALCLPTPMAVAYIKLSFRGGNGYGN